MAGDIAQSSHQAAFCSSVLALNKNIYLDILKEHLEPFLVKNYRQGGYVFFAELASCHYTHSVQEDLKTKGNAVMPKSINTVNAPKARQIKDFWDNLKVKIYEGSWEAKSIKELKQRIKLCLRSLDLKFVQDHMLSVRTRLVRVWKTGPE